MNSQLKSSIWLQFGAAIDTLDDAIQTCPDRLWHALLWNDTTENSKYAQFWYIAHHALFWLDLYLSGSVESFTPPAPFTLTESDANGFPERPYTRDELRAYLDYDRRKCQATIETLTDEKAKSSCKFPWGEVSFIELQLYSMRHVQEHAAQLNLLLGQNGVPVKGWVKKARDKTT